MRNTDQPRPSTDPVFTDRVRRGLAAAAADLPEPPGPARASRRAHERRRNRRALAGTIGVVALFSGITAISLQGDDPDADLATASDAALIDGEGVELEWSVAGDGLQQVRAAADTDEGALYALSTAPGSRLSDFPDGNVPRALYRLGDDGSWAPIALDGDDPDVAAFSQRGSTLYGLSTAPDTGEPQGSISTDGGDTWTTVGLGSIAPPSETVAWGMSNRVDVASTDDLTVAVVDSAFSVPVMDLFPELAQDETGEGPHYSWDQTADGVSLLRYDESGIDEAAAGVSASSMTPDPDDEPDPTVVRTVPWADLGVGGPQDLAGPTTAYVVDGDTWTPVEHPLGPALSDSTSIQATGDQVVLSRSVYGDEGIERSEAFRSTDGRSWAPMTLPSLDGQLVPVGDAALVHLSYDDPGSAHQTLRVSRDGGVSWDVLDIASLDERIPSGDEGNATEHWFNVAGGPLGLALAVHVGDPADGGVRSLLLFSEDVRSWSVTDLHEVSPDSVNGFGQPIVGTDRVVVPGFGEPGDSKTPGDTMTVIGTPVRG